MWPSLAAHNRWHRNLDGRDPFRCKLPHGSVTTTERYYFRYLTQEQQVIANAYGNIGL